MAHKRPSAAPEEVEHWSPRTLREKLVKIGARVVRHGRYVVFPLAEVALPRRLFAEILSRVDRLRARTGARRSMPTLDANSLAFSVGEAQASIPAAGQSGRHLP
jgi:hypothetical protein